MAKSRDNAPTTVSTLIAHTLERYEHGDRAAAALATRRALAIAGSHPTAWRVAAYVFEGAGTDSAGSVFSRVLAIDPMDADSWSDLAVLAIGAKRLEEGRRALRRAIAVRPSASPYWCSLAAAASDSEAGLRRAIAIAPIESRTWLVLARSLSAGRAPGASIVARRAVGLAPNEVDALIELGLAIRRSETPFTSPASSPRRPHGSAPSPSNARQPFKACSRGFWAWRARSPSGANPATSTSPAA